MSSTADPARGKAGTGMLRIASFIRSLSIRTKLMVMTLIVILPVVAVLLFNTARHRSDLITEAEKNALFIVQGISFQQESDVEGLRQLLVALSLNTDVRTRNIAACNRLLGGIVKENPRKLNLGIADPRGRIYSSGENIVPFSIDISSRKYFTDAVKTKRFSCGEFVIGKITGMPSFHYSYPVFDDAGNLLCVLYASINRNNFDDLLKDVPLPHGTILNLTDHKGVIMYSNLDPEKFTGLPDSPGMRRYIAGAEREGAFFSTGIDGVPRLYSFKQQFLPGSDKPYLYIRAGIPEEEALGKANRELALSLVLIGIILTGVLMLAWFFGEKFILKRLNSVIGAAREISSGNLHARTGIVNTEGEMGLLAATFDEMGASLESREEEQKHLIAELRKALENVKVLSGFLPICSSCKKIRNDTGYWQQVEEYVSTHSDAVFSHGLCPDCFKKLYPDIAREYFEEKEGKNKSD